MSFIEPLFDYLREKKEEGKQNYDFVYNFFQTM